MGMNGATSAIVSAREICGGGRVYWWWVRELGLEEEEEAEGDLAALNSAAVKRGRAGRGGGAGGEAMWRR